MDLGCSVHITREKQFLEHIKAVKGKTVTTVGGECHKILEKDEVMFKTDDDEIKIKDVLYSPSIKRNLLSVESLIDTGRVVMFTATHAYILDNIHKQKVVAYGEIDIHNGLYRFGD